MPGTMAARELLNNTTFAPPGAAGPLRVTVPVDGLPPTTLVGFKDKPVTVGAMIVRDADCADVPSFVVMVAIVWVSTPMVVTVNVAEVWPEATVTVAGTVADALEEEIETTVPLGAAGPLKVTVPVEVEPPIRVVGFRLNATKAAGLIVRLADWIDEPRVALTEATVTPLTPVVFAVNVVVV